MSASTGWIHTARRVLPAFFRLSRRTAPTWRRGTIGDIDADELAAAGVSAILWDVDGTLMSHHAREVDPALRDAFEMLVADVRFRHAIVSNCQLPRFRELGTMFPEIPILLGFQTEEGAAFRILEGGEERHAGPGRSALPPPGSEERGPGVSPMRKPAAELVEEAARQLGIEDASRTIMVGDQYFTDVVSANLAGARSLKVRTLDRPSFPLAVRLSQRFETAWVALLRALRLLPDA